MSFETLQPIDADQEKMVVVQKVKNYFEVLLSNLQDGGSEFEEEGEEQRVESILEAIDDDDFGPVFQYLEKEISGLKQYDASGDAESTVYLNDLENLKDSLLLLER